MPRALTNASNTVNLTTVNSTLTCHKLGPHRAVQQQTLSGGSHTSQSLNPAYWTSTEIYRDKLYKVQVLKYTVRMLIDSGNTEQQHSKNTEIYFMNPHFSTSNLEVPKKQI